MTDPKAVEKTATWLRNTADLFNRSIATSDGETVKISRPVARFLRDRMYDLADELVQQKRGAA